MTRKPGIRFAKSSRRIGQKGKPGGAFSRDPEPLAVPPSDGDLTRKGADWVITYDGDECRVVRQRCLPGRVFLPEAEASIGRTVSELIGPVQGEEFKSAMQRAIATGIVQVITISALGRVFQAALTPGRQAFVRELSRTLRRPRWETNATSARKR